MNCTFQKLIFVLKAKLLLFTVEEVNFYVPRTNSIFCETAFKVADPVAWDTLARPSLLGHTAK